MAEETEGLVGIAVAEKRFEFILPVSGHSMSLRYATRKDKALALKAANSLPEGSELSKEDMYELTYLSQIIEPPVTIDQLADMKEKDLVFLRIADDKVNNISKEDLDKLTASFVQALK
jgi:hypothetical protein